MLTRPTPPGSTRVTKLPATKEYCSKTDIFRIGGSGLSATTALHSFFDRDPPNLTEKKDPFLRLMEIIQADKEKLTDDVIRFVCAYFQIEPKEIEKIQHIAEHRWALFDFLRGLFYTRSVSEFLKALRYNDEQIQFKNWDNVITTNALLVQIIRGLAEKHRVVLTEFDLSGLNLTGIDLSGASFANMRLRGANLTGVDFVGADLRGADLTNADLTEARFAYGNPNNPQLDGLILNGAIASSKSMLKLNLSRVHAKALRLKFNLPVLFNEETGYMYFGLPREKKQTNDGTTQTTDFQPTSQHYNILQTIHSISSAFQGDLDSKEALELRNLKVRLMSQLISAFQTKCDAEEQTAAVICDREHNFLQVLLCDPMYLENEVIRSFLEDHVFRCHLQDINTKGHIFREEEVVYLYEIMENTLQNAQYHWFFTHYSGFINQLLYSSALYHLPANQEYVKMEFLLRKAYLDAIPQEIFALIDRSSLEFNGNPLQGDRMPENMIFLSPNKLNAMHLPTVYYEKNAFSDNRFFHIPKIQTAQGSSIGWSEFGHIVCESNVNNRHTYAYVTPTVIENITKSVAFFKIAYESFITGFKSHLFFEQFEFTNGRKDYFKTALVTKTSKRPAVSIHEQEELKTAFETLISTKGDEYILSFHACSWIKATYFVSNENTDVYIRGWQGIYLSLAALFTRFSSESFLGTSNDSPQYLRSVAFACVRSALDLPPLARRPLDQRVLKDWQNKLKTNHCTDLLSKEIIAFLRMHYNLELRQVIHANWL